MTVQQAQKHLSKLIDAVLAGEEVVIARGSTPLVRLMPTETPRPARKFGAYEGEFEMTDAFFEPLPEDELRLWSCEDD